MSVLLLTHFYTCAFMTGIIWLVQIVQYPSFHLVGAKEFGDFHRAHSNRISPIVGIAMIAELTSGIDLWLKEMNLFWSFNLGLLAVIWAATAFLSIPLHALLGKEKSEKLISRLVWTNWLRTLAWTIRSAGLAALLLGKISF